MSGPRRLDPHAFAPADLFDRLAGHDHEPDGWLAFGVGCTEPGCDATVVNVEGPFDDVVIEWSE